MTSKDARERTIKHYQQDLDLFYRIYSDEKEKDHPDQHRLAETKKIICFKGIHYLGYTRQNPDEHNHALEFLRSLDGIMDVINDSEKILCSRLKSKNGK